MNINKALRKEREKARKGMGTKGFAPIHKKMKMPKGSKGFIETGVRHIIV